MDNKDLRVKASFTFYGLELDKLLTHVEEGKRYAWKNGERFLGASFDVDNDGYVYVHIAGLETLKL